MSGNNAPLRLALSHGHADVIECLHKVYGIDREDARDVSLEELECAITCCHADAVQYFLRAFGNPLPKDNLKKYMDNSTMYTTLYSTLLAANNKKE